MASIIIELVLAVRPWSLTAAIIPVLLTTAATGASFTSEEFFRVLIMAVCVQSGANLTNTYYDFANGVDGKNIGERTLVDKKLAPRTVLLQSLTFFAIGTASVMPYLVSNTSDLFLMTIFAFGLVLSYFYTATPVGLKYKALGDITIFLCFGPLLMQCTSLIVAHKMVHEVNYLSVPVALLTEAILHANNTRDIESDRRAGAVTLAGLLGLETSVLMYKALIIGAYLSSIIIAALFHYGCLLTLITLPMGLDLIKKMSGNDRKALDEETAKVHLPFGITLLVGILTTSSGFLAMTGVPV